MSDDPVDGGTVTYHRADYRPGTDEPWLLWFTKDQADPYWFTAEQGEAMGLTPPEPAQSTAFSVVLDELIAVEPDAPFSRKQVAQSIVDMLEVARLLRDARQDPQPTADTPSDDIDFDALPTGTVLWDGKDFLLRLPGGWTYNPPEDESDYYDIWETEAPKMSVVYQPPVLSPRQHLEALLAGRDDGDELIEYAGKHWVSNKPEIMHPQYVLTGSIGDAARGGA